MELAPIIQAHHWQGLAYAILFFGMLFEATFFLFTAMLLVAEHALNPAATIAVVAAGAFLEELLWYYAGVKLGNIKRIADWVNKRVARFDRHLEEKTLHTLFISKFVYGVHRAVLVRSGMVKLPLKRYFKDAFAATVVWLVAVGALGFAFGQSYQHFKRYLHYAELLPLLAFAAYYGLDYLVSKKLKKSL